MPLTRTLNRAITTPYKLPYLQPRLSLRVLLTPSERRRPWILYFTPGLVAAQFSHIAFAVLGLRTLRHFLLPPVPRGRYSFDVSPWRLGIYFVVAIFSTLILTPLEVIKTRLAIQRNHSAAGFNPVPQEENDTVTEGLEQYPGEEDVIG
jgi:hypothetical protein